MGSAKSARILAIGATWRLTGIAAAGDDVDARGGVRVGSIMVQEMTIAGE